MVFWKQRSPFDKDNDPKTATPESSQTSVGSSNASRTASSAGATAGREQPAGRVAESNRPPVGREEPPPTVVEGAGAARAGAPRASEESAEERYGKIRSALGPGTVIQGKLSFDTPVRIDGKLSGEIFSSRELIVGQQGVIDAQVEVASLVVMGRVKGNVKAGERIELLAGGVLEGDITAPSFVMQEGAVFNGRCKMLHQEKAAVSERSRAEQEKARVDQAKERREASAQKGASAQNRAVSGSNGTARTNDADEQIPSKGVPLQ